MRYTLTILALCLVVFACNQEPKPPKDLIQEETYINLLIELQLVKAYQKKLQPDSTVIDSLRQVLFNRYSVTKKQFQQSHQFYRQHLKAQQARIDSAIERLRKDRLTPPDSVASDTTQQTDQG